MSNKLSSTLRREVDHLGWGGHFRAVVGAGETWFVGDLPVDMECAGRASCVGVLVAATEPKAGGFGEFPPRLRLTSLFELHKVLVG